MLKKYIVSETIIIRTGKILIMDDEKLVRDVAGRMLERLGYEVDFAKDGNEAIELYKQAKDASDPFDAVLIDLNIPQGMGGEETMQKLKKIDPAVKAIVFSGDTYHPLMMDFRQYGFVGAISKPFSFGELSYILNQAILV